MTSLYRENDTCGIGSRYFWIYLYSLYLTIRSILSNSSLFAFFLLKKFFTFLVLFEMHLAVCCRAFLAFSRYLWDLLDYFKMHEDHLHFFIAVQFSCGNSLLYSTSSAILLYFDYLCILPILCLIINYSWKVYSVENIKTNISQKQSI